MKVCVGCRQIKDNDQFHKKKQTKDGFDYYCKTCKAVSKVKYLISIGENVNEARFKAVFNGLSSVAKKVFDAVPRDTYWTSGRIANELSKAHGSNPEMNILKGCLNTLIQHGLVIEGTPGTFAKVAITKKIVKIKEIEDKQTQQMEIKMTAKEVNAFDAIREIAIKFMDTAKDINQLASEIDVKLSDVEKEMADNVKDTEKLKQLQSLLKSLG